jgi:hypothetical protein
LIEMHEEAHANVKKNGASASQVSGTGSIEVASNRRTITTEEMLKRREERAAQELAKPLTHQKPNETCNCGSGKKFKKCCGFAKVKMSAASTLDPPQGQCLGPCPEKADHMLVQFPDIEEPVSISMDQLAINRGHAAQNLATRNLTPAGLERPQRDLTAYEILMAPRELANRVVLRDRPGEESQRQSSDTSS